MSDASDRRILEVRHYDDPQGVEQTVIRYADGTSQTHAHLSWTEARSIAERAGLEHRDDQPGSTTWTRRLAAI